MAAFRTKMSHSMPCTLLTTTLMNAATARKTLYRTTHWVGIMSLLVACTAKPPVPPPEVVTVPTPPATVVTPAPASTDIVTKVSHAKTPREYRRDGATHLYANNSGRIFAGKLPPLLYAIGVLQVDINAKGAVTALRWMRAPSHAPEVVAEIERSVRQAAPFPAPVKMGHVTYTDTWLWHKSGQFQLDTLTEGQL